MGPWGALEATKGARPCGARPLDRLRRRRVPRRAAHRSIESRARLFDPPAGSKGRRRDQRPHRLGMRQLGEVVRPCAEHRTDVARAQPFTHTPARQEARHQHQRDEHGGHCGRNRLAHRQANADRDQRGREHELEVDRRARGYIHRRRAPNKTKGLPHPLSATVAPFRAWRGSRCAVGRPTKGTHVSKNTIALLRQFLTARSIIEAPLRPLKLTEQAQLCLGKRTGTRLAAVLAHA